MSSLPPLPYEHTYTLVGRISPNNIITVSILGHKMMVSDLVPPDKPITFMISVRNGHYRNTCKLYHQMVSDAVAKYLLQELAKGISILTDVLQLSIHEMKVSLVNSSLQEILKAIHP